MAFFCLKMTWAFRYRDSLSLLVPLGMCRRKGGEQMEREKKKYCAWSPLELDEMFFSFLSHLLLCPCALTAVHSCLSG